MCRHDEARLSLILETLGEAGVIGDLAKMVFDYDKCPKKQRREWIL